MFKRIVLLFSVFIILCFVNFFLSPKKILGYNCSILVGSLPNENSTIPLHMGVVSPDLPSGQTYSLKLWGPSWTQFDFQEGWGWKDFSINTGSLQDFDQTKKANFIFDAPPPPSLFSPSPWTGAYLQTPGIWWKGKYALVVTQGNNAPICQTNFIITAAPPQVLQKDCTVNVTTQGQSTYITVDDDVLVTSPDIAFQQTTTTPPPYDPYNPIFRLYLDGKEIQQPTIGQYHSGIILNKLQPKTYLLEIKTFNRSLQCPQTIFKVHDRLEPTPSPTSTPPPVPCSIGLEASPAGVHKSELDKTTPVQTQVTWQIGNCPVQPNDFILLVPKDQSDDIFTGKLGFYPFDPTCADITQNPPPTINPQLKSFCAVSIPHNLDIGTYQFRYVYGSTAESWLRYSASGWADYQVLPEDKPIPTSAPFPTIVFVMGKVNAPPPSLPPGSSAAGQGCDIYNGNIVPNPGAGNEGIMTAIGCVPTEPVRLVRGLLKVILMAGGGLAMLLMLGGVFQMITSAGNPDNVKKGADQISNAAIGLLFIIFSVMLMQVIGVDILWIISP